MSKWLCTVPVLLWEMGNLKSSKDQSANGGCIQGPNLKTESIYPVLNVRPCKNPHAIHSEKQTWCSKIQLLTLRWDFLRSSAVSHSQSYLIISGLRRSTPCLPQNPATSSFLPSSQWKQYQRASAWKGLIRTWFKLKKRSTQPTSNSNTNYSTSVSTGSHFRMLLGVGRRGKRRGEKWTKDKAWLQSESATTSQKQKSK